MASVAIRKVMAVTGMLVLLVSNGLTATALSVYDESLLNETLQMAA